MRVLITGALGQDGSMLCEKHLEDGDQVWGTNSFGSVVDMKTFKKIDGELYQTDTAFKILDQLNPDRIYHLAAKHSSSANNDCVDNKIRKDMYLCHVVITKNILTWQITNPTSKLLVALTSQMYSTIRYEERINEKSKLAPKNFYAQTKTMAFDILRHYRSKYDVKVYGAILFNHTSKRNKPEFLFPILAKQMSDVFRTQSNTIELRDPDAKIDITHALEVCEGLYKFINYEPSCDLIFASGTLIKISDLVHRTFELLNFNGNYSIIRTGKKVKQNGTIFGDSSLATKIIGWRAVKTPEEILAEQITAIIGSQ